MHQTAIVLACLTFLAHARRLPGPAGHSQKSSPLRAVKLKEASRQNGARATADPSAAFAAFLVTSEPAAAFHASSPLAAKWSGSSRRAPLTRMTEKSMVAAYLAPKDNATAERSVLFDTRGYVIPNLGDIVRWPGKWQDEYTYGQVDFLQKLGDKDKTIEAEVIPLQDIGDNLYRVPAVARRKRIRMDIKDLGVVKSNFVKEKDAYKLKIAVKKYEPKEVDPEVAARGLAEYAELKAELLKLGGLTAAAGTLAAIVRYGPDTAYAFASGAVSSLIYLGLLELNTDLVGGGSPVVATLSGLRFLTPVLAFGLVLAKQAYLFGGFSLESGEPNFIGQAFPKEQIAPLVAGLLVYKAGLVLKNLQTVWSDLMREEESSLPISPDSIGFSGYGMIAKGIKKSLQSGAKTVEEAAATATSDTSSGQVVAICGPSDDSKRNFIARLLQESPDKYGITVACTTRAPREDEVNGTDFTFLDDEQFTAMVMDGQFIETSKMGNVRFGNSVAAVQTVSQNGKVCLMDLDVTDLPSLKQRSELSVFAAWVPPPEGQGDASKLRALAKDSGYFDTLLDSGSDADYSNLKQAIKGRFNQV